MNKDEFEKLLDQCRVEKVLHKKWLGSEADAFVEVKSLVTRCKECNLEVDRAPIRIHKVVMQDTWMSYCKDCHNYLNPDTGRYDTKRNYVDTYKRLKLRKDKINDQKSNNSNK